MITILLPEIHEIYNPEDRTFTEVNWKEKTLHLEHSLVSVQKWEQKWHKPFLGKEEKTLEQQMYYIKCMAVDGKLTDTDIRRLTQDDIKRINDYILDPATATWFANNGREIGKDKVIITAERIYGQMVGYRIPFECKKWHLNSLMTLIRVCAENNKPRKKMRKQDIYDKYDAINRANKAKYHTKG